jgi:hypothetical protein
VNDGGIMRVSYVCVRFDRGACPKSHIQSDDSVEITSMNPWRCYLPAAQSLHPRSKRLPGHLDVIRRNRKLTNLRIFAGQLL